MSQLVSTKSHRCAPPPLALLNLEIKTNTFRLVKMSLQLSGMFLYLEIISCHTPGATFIRFSG